MKDRDTFDLLFGALNNFAQGATPPEVSSVLTSARLTAIAKPDGGVRGIATGTTIRRVVARKLAKQFIKRFEEECSPFQYVLSTRGGTDCVGHMRMTMFFVLRCLRGCFECQELDPFYPSYGCRTVPHRTTVGSTTKAGVVWSRRLRARRHLDATPLLYRPPRSIGGSVRVAEPQRTDLRVPGRRVSGVPTSPGPRRSIGQGGRHKPSRRQDASLEQISRRAGLAPQWHHRVGDTHRV